MTMIRARAPTPKRQIRVRIRRRAGSSAVRSFFSSSVSLIASTIWDTPYTGGDGAEEADQPVTHGPAPAASPVQSRTVVSLP